MLFVKKVQEPSPRATKVQRLKGSSGKKGLLVAA